MLASAIPAKFPIPWGNAAGGSYIRAIPTLSQIGIQNGAASLTDGFPPLCFTPVASGGTPPFGQDFNGILKQITQWNQWQSAGGPIVYDAVFAAAVGGYPSGAVVASALVPGLYWRSTTDNNVTNPDTLGSSVGWVQFGLIKLTAPTTFYVRTDGSDNNFGLSNSAGGAFLTLQHAATVLQTMYDLNGQQASIQIGSGSFAGATFIGPCSGQTGPLLVIGNGRANTTISSALIADTGSYIQISALKSAGGTNSFVSNARMTIGAGIEVGALAGPNSAHFYNSGGTLQITADYFITGGAASHYQCFSANGLVVANSLNITLTGTPAFTQFVNLDLAGGLVVANSSGVTTFSGAATGQRFVINNLSLCYTFGQGINYFPGSTPGTNLGNGAIYS